MGKSNSISVHRPKTLEEFKKLNRELNSRGFIAIDALKPGLVRTLTLGDRDPSNGQAEDMAACIGGGAWSNGPLSKVAWAFDARDNSVVSVADKDGNLLGLGYVKWGAGNAIPSVIPPLALSSPYTAAPLRYIADLTTGLGPRLMYHFQDDTLCEYKNAGYKILERLEKAEKGEQDNTTVGDFAIDPATSRMVHIDELEEKDRPKPTTYRLGSDYWKKAYDEWERTWYGDDVKEDDGTITHTPGAKEFLDDNNLDLHFTQCEQDDVMLDIYFPTVGFQRGRRGKWDPKIVQVSMLPSHSTRLEVMNEYRHINHVYFSDQWRTLGSTNVKTVGVDKDKVVMYPAAMPQHLLSDLRYIVESNQRTRIKDRPVWVVCPTFYPSGQKPYYPQPAWWSIFLSKAFDFSSTILYDKAKARENSTSWGKIIYISLDYLNMVFADQGIAGDREKQEKFIGELDQNVEQFLQMRENNGKMMRQFMWIGQDGKEHHNVEVVDVAKTSNDVAKAGKEELELSTSPIFLALQVDPRLVGVPMVAASNGGTALREMHLLKQQQLNPKQRLYLQFLNTVARFNGWDERAEFHIKQQTLTTLDNNKTGTVETIAGEGA